MVVVVEEDILMSMYEWINEEGFCRGKRRVGKEQRQNRKEQKRAHVRWVY